MKITIDVDALTTRHSFSGDDIQHILEIRIFGHRINVPVTDKVIQAIDLYITDEVHSQPSPRETRREYPPSYDEGVEYDFGEVSYSDMEEEP